MTPPTPYLADADVTLWHGDALDVLRGMESDSVDCVVTSPPYWGLRDYGTGAWEGGDEGCDHRVEASGDKKRRDEGRAQTGTFHGSRQVSELDAPQFAGACGKCGARRVDSQLGLEPTPDAYVPRMVEVFREVRRVLCPHGTCWVNLGSSFASGGTPATQSRRPERDRAYGSGDIAPTDFLGPGSAGLDLCDGCRDATRSHRGRTARSTPPLEPDALAPLTTTCADAPQGSGQALLGASLPDAQASTTSRSSEPLPAACSHCANCGACLSVLRSSSRDARLCARMGQSIDGTFSTLPSSSARTSDTEPSALAYLYSSIAARRLKPKDDVGIPWLVALALQMDGWYLRSEIIWAKKNCMPESVADRPTKSHEQVFLLTKQPRYFFDQEAVREPAAESVIARAAYAVGGTKVVAERNDNGRAQERTYADYAHGRNVRSVWTIATQPYPEAHFATYPEELVRRCVLAGCPERVCRTCGKASERLVETSGGTTGQSWGDHTNDAVAGNFKTGGKEVRASQGFGDYKRDTVGWSDCGHNDWRPGRVLDPFVGSGTTCLVARNHGRHSVGIDLNEQYLELAATRLQQLSLLSEPALSPTGSAEP